MNIKVHKEQLNTIVYIVSDLMSKGLPFLLLPIYTSALSQEEFGYISIFNVIVEVFLIIVLMGGNSFYKVKFFDIKQKYKLSLGYWLYKQSTYIYCILIMLLIIASSVVAYPLYLLLLAASIALIQSCIFINQAHFQSDGRAKVFGFVNITFSTISAAITVSLLVFEFKEESRYIAYFFASIVAFLLSFYFYRKTGEREELAKEIKLESFSFGIKILPHALSWWLKSGSDRIIIYMLMGANFVGVYSLASQYSLIFLVLSNAMIQAYVPKLISYLSKNNLKQASGIVIGILVSNTVILILVWAAAPLVFDYFIDPKFYDTLKFVPYLLFACYIQAFTTLISNYFYYYKLLSLLSIITFTFSCLHVVLSYVLGQKYGIEGVVISSILTYLGTGGTMVFYLIKKVKNV